MPAKILLSTYVVRLKQKNKNQYQILSKLDGTTDFYELFRKFIKSLGKEHHSEEIEKERRGITLRLRSGAVKNDKKRNVFGFVESGVSGDSGFIYNLTKRQDVGKLNVDDAKMVPVFYFIDVPKNRDYALLILQRRSTHGIKGIFYKALRKYLDDSGLKDYKLEIHNFLVGRVLDEMLSKGRVTEMSCITHQIPDDTSRFLDNGHNTFVGTLKKTYTAKKDLPVRGLIKYLLSRPDKTGMVEIPGLNEGYDEVDFELDVNGTKKTIHMSKTSKNLPDYDVTNNINFDNDNNPSIIDLKREARLLIKDMVDHYEAKIADKFNV